MIDRLIPERILEIEHYLFCSPIYTLDRVCCAAIICSGSCKCKYDNGLQTKKKQT